VRDRVRKDTTHQSPPTVSTTSHAPAPIKPEPHGTPFPTIQTRPANTRAHDPASSVPEAHAHTLCGAHASHRIAALAAPPSYRDVTIPPACPAPRAAMRPRSIARPYPQSGAVPMPAHAPLRGTPRQPHQPRQPCQPRQPIVARARAARVPTQRHSPSSEGTPPAHLAHLRSSLASPRLYRFSRASAKISCLNGSWLRKLVLFFFTWSERDAFVLLTAVRFSKR